MLKRTRYKNSSNQFQKCLLLGIGLFFLSPVFAQFKVKIIITGSPESHKADPVFIAGNFNGWNPGLAEYRLNGVNNVPAIELKMESAGSYEFKFTRGSWQKVECTANGSDIANRIFQLNRDTVIYLSIAGWTDDFVRVPKLHTASSNVSIMDTAFAMPQLSRSRRIWIYLPAGYQSGKKSYPVIYLQDGQNVFDRYSAAYSEEWGVDETMDSLASKGYPPFIVVAIDNGGEKRMNEYNPCLLTLKDSVMSKTFTPEADQYLDFMVKTLKPYIDKRFRTKRSRENTSVAGASMGGLISYYAVLKYPQVFGNAGVFSPAFWTADSIENLTDSVANKLNAKFFFYMGEMEGKDYVDQMNRIADKIGRKSSSLIYLVSDPVGIHNEIFWRKWFPEFYKWLVADGFNVLTKPKD